MRKLNRLFFLLFASLLLLVSACSAQEAADPIKDKQEIVSLIKALYKIKPEAYYFANFPEYSVKRHDELSARFFDLSVFPREKGTKANPIQTHVLPELFPREYDPNDLVAENRNEPLPKVKVEAPELDGQRGKVVAKLSDGSLVQFFLQKRSEGWRIYKVRTFTRVPKNLYFLPGLKALEDAYDGDMDEYPSTPNSPSFRTSNQASVTLSPW